MPINSEWVEPEELLTHKDVTVWLTYKDDDVARKERALEIVMDLTGIFDRVKAEREKQYVAVGIEQQ